MVFFMIENDLVSKILRAKSRQSWQGLARECASDPMQITYLLDILLSSQPRLQQCASNVVNHYFELHPEQLSAYAATIIQALQPRVVPSAVKRTVMRLMQQVSLNHLSETDFGFLVDRCFGYLQDANEAIAVRAFSLTIAHKASLIHPELRNELKPILNHVMDYGSAAEKSRARKILKSLH
ncbi:MAG TPA: hypothetical protein VL947_00835 [Cytophagales bacterium]|nr:hypothetical protein [Cytophagales bacterium]